MFVLEYKDLLLLVVGFFSSFAATWFGAVMYAKYKARLEHEPLNRILDFDGGEIHVIYPPRPGPRPVGSVLEKSKGAILPYTSIEDYLAVNNMISALLKVGRRSHKFRMCKDLDTGIPLPEAKLTENLVLICSPKSNVITDQFFEKLTSAGATHFDNCFRFVAAKQEKWDIAQARGNGRWRSKTYEQMEKYVAELNAAQEEGLNTDEKLLSKQKYIDVAVITKRQNPWNTSKKVIAVSGVRGIGTWGAAECIKKNYMDIYARLPRDKKHWDFSALIEVHYEDYDITDTKVIGFEHTAPTVS